MKADKDTFPSTNGAKLIIMLTRKEIKDILKVIGWCGLLFLASRGLASFFIPMGMECDAYMHQSEPCPFGPGIVGTHECIMGKWYKCQIKPKQ